MIIDMYKIRIPQIKLVTHLSMLSFLYHQVLAQQTESMFY